MHGTAETIHVTLGPGRAESVRDALRIQGIDERVIGLTDDLSFGPINPPDAALRHSWMRSVLRHRPDDDPAGSVDASDADRPWADATAPNVRPVYWVCRSCAAEHADFLEFVSRMKEKPFDVVDATGLDFTTLDGVEQPWSLGLMRPDDIVASGLPARRRAMSSDEIRSAAMVWSRLREENAPFRIVKDGSLVSAELTCFDAFLIDNAVSEREVAAKLVGRTLTSMSYGMHPPGQSPNDIVLFGRLLALGEEGLLEVTGAGPGMRDYKVRKPIVAQ